MDANGYYESLLAQGYGPEEATKFTQQHYPQFGQDPTTPAPVTMPAPASMPAPIVEIPQSQVISGVTGMAVPQNAVIMQPPTTTTSKGMRITSGIFGILMSFALIGYSLLVISIWAEASEEIKLELEILGLFADEDDDVAAFYDSTDSFLSTISFFYYTILLVSISTLVISILQFFNKPWGTKALLYSTGLLLLILLGTGMYEVSSFNEIADDYENLTGESLGDMPTFFEVSGTIGGYCAGLCLGMFALLAYIGRPKSLPVQMVMN